MDLKLQLLDSFPARGSDARDYKVCAYERLRRDETLQDGQDRWLSTGVIEYRLASGERIDAGADGSMTLVSRGVALSRL